METTLTAQEKSILLNSMIHYRAHKQRVLAVTEEPVLRAGLTLLVEQIDQLIDRTVDLPVRQPNSSLA